MSEERGDDGRFVAGTNGATNGASELVSLNGEAILTPEQVKRVQNTWFTRDRAMSHLRVSRRKFDHLMATDQIPPGKCLRIKGAWWFEPDHLDHIKAEQNDELDMGDPTLFKGLAEVLRANVAGVSAYQDHVEKFVVKLLQGSDEQGGFLRELMQDVREDNRILRARVQELEAKLSAQFTAFEDAATRQNERDLALVVETKKQERISDLFGLAKEYVPRVLEQVAGIRKIKQVVAGLKDEEIDLLVGMKKIDETMAKQLKAIRADEHMRTERAAKALGVKLPESSGDKPAEASGKAGSEQTAAPSSEPATGQGGGK
jgi:hypothetical protein